MKCPKCEKEIDSASYTETMSGTAHLETNQNDKTIVEEWEEDDIGKNTIFYCPNCGEDISSEIQII